MKPPRIVKIAHCSACGTSHLRQPPVEMRVSTCCLCNGRPFELLWYLSHDALIGGAAELRWLRRSKPKAKRPAPKKAPKKKPAKRKR